MTPTPPFRPSPSRDDGDEGEFDRLVARALSSPQAPAAWQRAAEGLWAQAATARPWLLAQARQVLHALLSFDSWAPGTGAMAVRSLPGPTRHLVFSTQGRDVDLRISPEAEAFSLSGQILGPDETGQIELTGLAAQAQGFQGALNELGEFRLQGVPAGSYRLTLRLAGDDVIVEPLEVGGSVTPM